MAAALPLKRKALTPASGFVPKRSFSRLVQDEMKIDGLERKVRKLKKASNADLHVMNNQLTTALTTAGFVGLVSTVAIGDDNADRTGASINPLQLDLWHTINAGTTQSQVIRFILFQDKQAYGAAPAVLDVLQSADPNAPYNVPNRLAKRFRILADYSMTGVIGTAGATTGCLVQRKKTIRRMNKVNFTGTTAAAASAGSGSIWLLGITSAAANQGTHQFNWALSFNS